MDAGLALLKRDPDSGSQLVQYIDSLSQRDTELECFLEPGKYILVPRTNGLSL